MKILRVILLALFAVVAGTVWAQGPTASISGTVLDPQGLPVVGADVTVTNQNTGTEYKLTTSERGAYTVSALPSGVYRVSATSSGFKTTTVADIRVDAGTARSVAPITMELGVVAETVTVEGGAELVNTANAVLTTSVENKQIQQLPLLNRSPLNLVDLQAGVNASGAMPRVINGMRTSYTNVTVDGVNVQDNFIRSNGIDFLPNLLLINQVNEFTLINQNADPSYGNGASQVAFSTPSGTNDWHGDVFWYHRNNKFAAGDWFDNAGGVEKPQLIQNQGGFGVGGPIVHDKLFFYGYWELFRNRQTDRDTTPPLTLTSTAKQGMYQYLTSSAIDTLATPLPAGVTCQSAATTIPVGTLCSADVLALAGVTMDSFVANTVLPLLPEPNDLTQGDGLNYAGYGFNQNNNRTRDNYGFRVDYTPSIHHSFSGTWQWNRDIVDRPDIDTTFSKAPVVTNDDTTKFLAASWRWSPSGRFTNEARGGFNLAPANFAVNQDFGSFVIGDVASSSGGDANTGTYLFNNPINNFRPQGRDTDTWNVQDNATYVMGDHTLKFGGFYQHIKASPFSSFNIPPSFDIGFGLTNTSTLLAADLPGASSSNRSDANSLLASLAGFIYGGASEYNVTSRDSGFVEGAINRRDYTLSNLSFYFNDSWRLRPNFTLNFGVRWEYTGRFDEKNALGLQPVVSDRTTEAMIAQVLNPDAVLDFAGSAVGNPFYDRDLNNFAPQIGIAWDPWGDGKTSIRAGYSINYVNDESIQSADNATSGDDGLNATTTLINIDTTISNLGSVSFPTPTFKVPRTLVDNINDFGDGFVPDTIYGVDPKLSSPYVQQWNLSIQRDIGWDTAIEVRYMGNHGVQLYRAIDLNQVNGLTNRSEWISEWTNARNNAFLAEANGLGFDPFCNGTGASNDFLGISDDFFGIGCVPLPLLTQVGADPSIGCFGGCFFLGFIQEMLRTGEIGDLAFLYVANGIDPQLFVPNFNAGPGDLLTNFSRSTYHAGVIEVRRRPVRGIYFQANYTFGKALTDFDGESSSRFDPLLDIFNPSKERNRAEFDITHAFKANFVIDVPMGRGHSISTGNWADKVIGGWSVGSIFTWQSGSPFSIMSNRATLNRFGRSVARNTATTNLSADEIAQHVGLFVTPDGVYIFDPAFIGDDGRAVGPDEQVCDFTLDNGSQALFCNPALGELGNLPRYAFNGPAYFNWDFSLIKNTPINERVGVEFRVEFFNFTNHPTFFTGSIAGISNRTGEDINSTSFGQSFATLSDRRIVQFGLRVTF
jgi:hypothetical protein